MTILVTGAAGVLGSRVAALLADAHDLRTTDLVPGNAPGKFTPADLTDLEQVRPLVEGCDVVVHCAAVHPWKPYTDEQYLDNNVKACFQVAKASAVAGVAKWVFTSSIAAVGYPGEFAPDEMPIPENAAPRTRDTYSLTKTLAEEVVRRFYRTHGLAAWCLRPVNFIPRDNDVAYGQALLSAMFTDPRDVALAHALAVERPVAGVQTCYLPPDLPFTSADIADVRAGIGVAERYYPGLTAWFAARQAEVPAPAGLFDPTVARDQLGWKPEWTLERWWREKEKG
jgi:nucleoside-diphosphate-sugar epimerase